MTYNFTYLKTTLIAFCLLAGLNVISAQNDPNCPEIVYGPGGEVFFVFPPNHGFDTLVTIGTSTGGLPATNIYSGTGSFTGNSPNVYTYYDEAGNEFPNTLTGTLVLNPTGTGSNGFIVCNYINGVLPLEMVSFTGRTTDRNTNLLEWITATESNTDWIVLERSVDAFNWETVERVRAQGWSFNLHQYSVEDTNPYLLTYYRLRIIDLDAVEYFSNTIVLERNSLSGVTISPVPAKDNVFLQFDAAEEGEITITLIDIHGRKLNEKVISTVTGLNTVEIDLRAYASGLYYVHLDNGEDQQTKRIIKQE